MKSFNKACLIAGFVSAIINEHICAMESLKFKKRFHSEGGEAVNFKKIKFEEDQDKFCKAFPRGFPSTLNYDGCKEAVESLRPRELLETDFYKNLVLKGLVA